MQSWEVCIVVYAELDLVLELKLEVSEFEKSIKIEILAFQNMKDWAQTDIWINLVNSSTCFKTSKSKSDN
jgi:hypothetical protein